MGSTKKVTSYRIIEEKVVQGRRVQLVEDDLGTLFLRSMSPNGKQLSLSAPIHTDKAALADAQELFPDRFPLGGLPVDAS
ncbi:MAG: hypothetical protein P8182_03350 [Deltaproteobacteria bacterium]